MTISDVYAPRLDALEVVLDMDLTEATRKELENLWSALETEFNDACLEADFSGIDNKGGK